MISDYYSIQQIQVEGTHTQVAGTHAQADVLLRPDSQVYEGHFPGEPVSPGVCNINMIRECMEKVVSQAEGREIDLMLSYIQQCRFTTLITPITHSALEVIIDILTAPTSELPVYKFTASIGHEGATYLTLKGEAKETPKS